MAIPLQEATHHVCVECSMVQQTCCTLQVPLTVEDIRRILSLGHPLSSFVGAAEYSEKDLVGEDSWFGESMARANGKLYRTGTRRQASGACVFLKEGVGCTLGEHRPAVCKMYPFWADASGNVAYQDEEFTFCHMAKLGTNVERGLQLLGETPETIRAHMRAFEEDGIRNGEWHREFAHRLVVAPDTVDESHLPREENPLHGGPRTPPAARYSRHAS